MLKAVGIKKPKCPYMLFQTWASANASSGLPTLLQGLTRQAHGVVPPMWLMLPARPLQWPQQNTWKQKYLQQQLIHLALNSYCLFFFFLSSPKMFSVPLSRELWLSPLPPEYNTPCSGVVCPCCFSLSALPLGAPTSYSRKGCPCASPLVSPVLPFPCGNGLFLLLPP